MHLQWLQINDEVGTFVNFHDNARLTLLPLSTHISFLHWLRKQADDDDRDDSKPEQNQSKVHVMNLGND